MKFLSKKDNFLFLAMMAFVFVATCVLAINKDLTVLSSRFTKVLAKEPKRFPDLPVLKDSSTFPVLSAQGVLAIDLTSGINLYDKNSDGPLLPASTTKIITALVALDSYPLDAVLTVGKNTGVDGQKMGLITGEKMKVEDLLYGLLVYSANDAAEVLAQNFCAPRSLGEVGPCGRDAFIMAMNVKAKELSMNNSKFANPVGLDEDGQITTPRDLIRASEVAMRDPEFAKIVGTKQISLTDATGKISYNLRNLNELLGSVPGVLGVKTGWTENARENLVTYLDRDGHKIIIAVLGSQDRFGETRELVDWIFANYSWQEVRVPQ